MAKKALTPRTIYWITALVLLVGGIFSFKNNFELQIGSFQQTLSFAHIGAILSGVLSMMSFAYASFKSSPPWKVWPIIHLLLSLGLIAFTIYAAFVADGLAETIVPNLESNANDINEWSNKSSDWGVWTSRAQSGFLAFLILQLVFFIYYFLTRKK